MKLTPVNVDATDHVFYDILNNRTDGTGKEVVFFDWVGSFMSSSEVPRQIEKIAECERDDKSIIVFDRNSSMLEGEVEYIHKHLNAILMEPVVRPRPGFIFMPYWVNQVEYPLEMFENRRRFQTGYRGYNLTTDLESIILSLIKGNEVSIGLDIKLPDDKHNVLKNVVCIEVFGYEQLETMILTGNDDEYKRGVLPDIRPLVYNGVVPLLYHNHKWFHSLFRQLVVNDVNDVDWFMGMYQTCGYGLMEDVFKNIMKYLPEMETGNFVDSIIEIAEKL